MIRVFVVVVRNSKNAAVKINNFYSLKIKKPMNNIQWLFLHALRG